MKYLADTHMHSIYSYDGQMTLESMVLKGISLGLKYMAFSEHLEFSQISFKQFLNRYQIYCDEINRLQEKYPNIILLKAIEFSNPEKYQIELEKINNLDIDFIIGSNHCISNDPSLIKAYYKTILEMVKIGGIDTVGHLDYIKRKVKGTIPLDILLEILYYMKKNNITLEINTSAKRRLNENSFPNDDIINLYLKEVNDKVTIGSDAHRLNEIYDGIEFIDNTYDINKGLYIKRKFVSLSKKICD